MKIRIIFLLAVVNCFFTINSYAQVMVSLSVDPNPSSQISTWVDSPNFAIFSVTNTDATLVGLDYKIKVELFKDNTLILSTNNNVVTQYLDLGMQTFFAEDVIPFTAIDIHASTTFQNDLLQTGMLPAGNYQFCVSLIGNFTAMPSEVCQNMTITSYQMPELISPIANIDISSSLFPATIFSWSPMVPPPSPLQGLKYIIAVVEVAAHQTPTQAFLYNYPIIEEEVLAGTQFIWPTTMEAPEETQQYVWSVKAVNFDDVAYKTTANGFVRPETFTVNIIVPPKSGEDTTTTVQDTTTTVQDTTSTVQDTTSTVQETTDICECFEFRYFELPVIMILGSENPSSFLNSSSNGNVYSPPNASIPELTIVQPEPIIYPRKVKIDGVLDIRDYLFDCISSSNEPKTIATATINWDDTHSETLANNGPFEHEYSTEDVAPDSIFVTYKIENRPSYPTFLCEKEVWVAVPQAVLDLNTADTSGTITAGSTFKVGEQGEFSVIVDSVGRTAGRHTGRGTVKIPWLSSRMAVEFSDISVALIDTNLHLSSGEVKVEDYPSAPNFSQIGSVHVGSITNFITSNNAQGGTGYSTNMTAVNGVLSAVNYFLTPKKMPLGVRSVQGDSISLIKMTFYPNRSEYDLVALKQTNAQLQSQNIGFKALNVKFKLRNPVSVPERIELVEDVIVGNTNNNVFFTFMAPVSSNIGCYIDFNEHGFQQYGLEVEADFTRDWMIPSPDDGGKSIASLSAVGTSWNDLILTGILEKSEIIATNEITILASNIAFDMSDSLNPANITFPSNYMGETTNLWNGFYMEQLVVELPNCFTTPAGGYIPVTIDDLIIDNQGLTFHLEATNVIQFGSAEISDLAVSIDTIHIEMEASSLVDAYVKGDIAIPVSDTNNYNPLHYNALFHHQQGTLDSNYIQLTINPVGPISSGLFRGSSGDFSILLNPTSSMMVYAGKVKGSGVPVKGFALDLDGNLKWVNTKVGPVLLNFMQLDFQGLKMAYHRNPSQSFSFGYDDPSFSHASPQKYISNFPVSITNIHYEPKQATGNQLSYGQLNMDVVFNLSPDIGGATSLGLKTSIEDNSSSGGGKFEPKCDGAVIDSINIHATLAAVTIKGAIGIRDNDPVYGDGFIGTLSAEFKAGIKASALAEFGNTSYLNSSLYRYWRVEAEATFPAPGIVFLPGIAFRGFGGGAYKNMDVSLNSSGTSYNFTPLKSNFGFIAKAVIATSPEEKTFNADCSLLAQFSQSNGITNIGFTGDFYVGASLSTASRLKAQIIGDVGVTYDFPLKHFNLSANVDVNAPPITTPSPANLVLDINGKTNLWYFKFGEPTNLNNVNVKGVSVYEYLMFGNDIQGPSGFTTQFRDAYYDATANYPSESNIDDGGVGSNTETGKGFALGIGFEFDTEGDLILNKYNNDRKKYTLYYNLAAGAELHLSFMEYAGSCSSPTSPITYSPIGINGYRAKGQLGLYAAAEVSVRKYYDDINPAGVQNEYSLARIGAGAWLAGEFPNPNYAAGAIDGQVQISVINCSFHLGFETGTQCSNSAAVSTVMVTQGDAAADQQNLLIQYVNPTKTINFPTESPLVVKYGLVPDEVFDVAEQQQNGMIENRTFKLVVARNLEMQDPITNIWSSVPIGSDVNNLGEFLYTISTLPTQATLTNIKGNNSQPASNTTAAASVSNMVVASGGSANTGLGAAPPSQISLQYPKNPTPPGYANLPPEPDPIINTLLDDINYRFTVTATLKEFTGGSWTTSAAGTSTNTGGSWINALKADTTPVTQTVIKTFRTGDMQQLQHSKN
jgi:hypothetical protein